MEQITRLAISTKILLGITSLLVAIGILLAGILHANKQTAKSTSELAAERARTAQIDQDDKAAVEKIRERNRQKTAATAASQK
jgi:hypothetical protein